MGEECDTPFPSPVRTNYWGNMLNRKQLVVVPSSNLEKAGVHEDDYAEFFAKVRKEDNLDITVSLLQNAFMGRPGHHVLFFSDSLPHMALSNWDDTVRLKEPRDAMEDALAKRMLQYNEEAKEDHEGENENFPFDSAANALFKGKISSWSCYENDSRVSEMLVEAIVKSLKEQGYFKEMKVPEQRL